MTRVAILSTGNELLYGKTVDANAAFISSKLHPLDLTVWRIMVTGDSIDELELAIRHLLGESDILIMTGGLGPTDDDNTIEALQRIFGFDIVADEPSRQRMDSFFMNIGMPMTARDMKMAEVPAGAAVILNEKGLAPGFIIARGDKTVMAMPGVPGEAADMMERSVIPYLKERLGIGAKASLSFSVIGMKESDINAAVVTMGIPSGSLEWGMTAKDGITTLTFVSGRGEVDLSVIADRARDAFGDRFLDPAWERPEEEIVENLRKAGLTVAFAESCTGGLISKQITDIPGSSDVFTGGIVAYDNSVKISQLGVPEDILSRYGAVSSETAAEMARGVRTALKSSIGISTTGIAGPGGGSDAKPVGTVWFGLADENGVKTFTSLIGGDRERVRSRAALIAIEYLRLYLKQLYKR